MAPFPFSRALSAILLLSCIVSAPAARAEAAEDRAPASGRSVRTAVPGADVPARIEPLRQALASGESATLALDRWCTDHGLAPAGSVRAEKLRPDSFPIPSEAGAKLRKAGGRIAERQVRLRCGGTRLSEARLWYVPKLLTPGMRRQLARTDTPFGAVVKPLHFRRVQSRIAILSRAGDDLLSVEAFLVLPDGRPFAFTREVYKSGLLERRP